MERGALIGPFPDGQQARALRAGKTSCRTPSLGCLIVTEDRAPGCIRLLPVHQGRP